MTEVVTPPSRSLWSDAYVRLKRDRWVVFSVIVFLLYVLVAIFTQIGWLATPWDTKIGVEYQPPSSESLAHIFGTDFLGRSVFYKVLHGTRVAISVGLVSCLIAVPVGVVLGAVSGYFGGWVDDLVVWFYTTLSAIPDMLLLIMIVWTLGKGLTSIYLALGITSWVSLARVMRGEFIKHKNRDYVVAADSLGASHYSKIFHHILPNVSHFVIIFISIQFITAIKAEVILSFLGLGVQGQPSWGLMIDDAKLELTSRGAWWGLAGATGGIFFIVVALNLLGDALRDALDPKIK
jgi:ABC-type dipeptide/oligopeptide/nickel transport system permease subunit